MREKTGLDDRFLSGWLQSLFSGNGFTRLLATFLGGEDDSPGDSAKATGPLARARDALKQIQEGRLVVMGEGRDAVATADLEEGVKALRNWLRQAGVDASALDPEGRKSAAEMEAVIRDAPRLGYLARAREYRVGMMNPGGIAIVLDGAAEDPRYHDGVLTDPMDIAKAVRVEMQKANAVALANGATPIDQATIEQKVREIVREGYIARVRDEFEGLKTDVRDFGIASSGRADHMNLWDKDLHEAIAKANEAAKELGFKPIDASVLDPEGKKSASEMEQKIGSYVSPLDVPAAPRPILPDNRRK